MILKKNIAQHKEIIKFIRQKEYTVATRSKNRKTFVDYLIQKKYRFSDYLADMPIHRMTKEEVRKRSDLLKEDTTKLKEYARIAKSDSFVRKKLIEELREVESKITEWVRKTDKEKESLRKRLDKPLKRKRS